MLNNNPIQANTPVQMFYVTDTSGKMTPLRFRYKNSEGEVKMASIEQVISREECHFAGIDERKIICTAMIEGDRVPLELRYHVNSQKWRVYQLLM